MLERSRVIEIVLAVGAVLAMIAVMIAIGISHGENEVLPLEGAQLLVAAIVGFVLLVTAIGIGLAYAFDDPIPENSS